MGLWPPSWRRALRWNRSGITASLLRRPRWGAVNRHTSWQAESPSPWPWRGSRWPHPTVGAASCHLERSDLSAGRRDPLGRGHPGPGDLHSYTVSYSNTVAISDVVAFDLSVGPRELVRDRHQCRISGLAYHPCGPRRPLLPPGQREPGVGGLRLLPDHLTGADTGRRFGSTSPMREARTRSCWAARHGADPSVSVDELLPATLSYGSTISRTRTTLDGQPAYQLSADGRPWTSRPALPHTSCAPQRAPRASSSNISTTR